MLICSQSGPNESKATKRMVRQQGSLWHLLGIGNVTSAPCGARVRGISNFGQTCYLNSILQSLASLQPFLFYLEHLEGELVRLNASLPAKQETPVVSTLLTLLKAINGTVPYHFIDTRGLLELVADKFAQFQGTVERPRDCRAQDAHEFLTALLDIVVKEYMELLSSTRTLQLHYVEDTEYQSKSVMTQIGQAGSRKAEEGEQSRFSHMHTVSTTAMKIMKTNTNCLTPHPLSGWMCSSHQCLECSHIPPLENYVVDTVMVRRPPAPASATSNNQRHEPLHLTRCEGFTRLENVTDFFCHNCTLNRVEERLEEDYQLYTAALDSLSSKRRDPDSLLQLQEEKTKAELYLKKVRETNPNNGPQVEDFLREYATEFSIAVPRSKGDAVEFTLLSRLPSILSIRVQQDRNDHVEFPEVLDMGTLCAYGGSQQFSGLIGTPTTKTSTGPCPILYRLQSIVEYAESPLGGHYQSYRRDVLSEETWLLVSDSHVRKVTWSEVQRCNSFLLFYDAV